MDAVQRIVQGEGSVFYPDAELPKDDLRCKYCRSVPAQPNSKFCSNSHAMVYFEEQKTAAKLRRKRLLRTPNFMHCVVCGIELTNSRVRKTCSHKCTETVRRIRYHSVGGKLLGCGKCIVCKRKIRSVPGVISQALCSDACKELYLNMNLPAILEGLEAGKQYPVPLLRFRFEVLKRDNFTCKHCGRSPLKDASVTLHVDHIYPAAKGGPNDFGNLITSCFECNEGKKDVLLSERHEKKLKKYAEQREAQRQP